MKSLKKIFCIVLGSISLCLGCIGVVVPVLPTTPLLLLSAFLFSQGSERLGAWLASTRVYRAYVEPFKRNGGISKQKKIHILGASLAVMSISAILVQKPIVWAILSLVALFLLYLMLVRIPTISKEQEEDYGFTYDALGQNAKADED